MHCIFRNVRVVSSNHIMFLEYEPKTYVEQGKKFTIFCAENADDVYWIKNGSTDILSRFDTLELRRVSMRETGVYICQGTTEEGYSVNVYIPVEVVGKSFVR